MSDSSEQQNRSKEDKSWSFDWTGILNQSFNFSFFELQFANCKRLEHNNDIYIFDEVGTGKTISSGLMALHYIYNKYKWEKEYEEKLGHKRLVNDEQQVIRGKDVGVDVLVITVNAVTQQFKNDWAETLCFNEQTGESQIGKNIFKDFNPYSNGRVEFINNVVGNNGDDEFAHFDSKKKIGLLIVDEAHLFIKDSTNGDEENSKRFNALKNLKAEKVVFLTATPDRYEKSNIDKYVELAGEILNKDSNVINVEERKKCVKECFGLDIKDENELICCKLDYELPVTRYFKDTLRKIQNNDFEKINAKRWIPEIWENPLNKYGVNQEDCFIQCFKEKMKDIQDDYYKSYGNSLDQSIFYVIYKICQVRKENNDKKELKDRFLVFIDRIDDGQNIIEQHFKYTNEKLTRDFFDIQIQEYKNGKNNNEIILTYKIVNSNTEDKAQDYGEGDNVPDILIVISKAVEQGVNLPAYSYIINFDVNKSIAALEQRFGRIDRINDTKYTNIHTVYVTDYRERNRENFIQAVYNYSELLRKEFTIPSKNVVINNQTLNYFMTEGNIDSYITYLCNQQDIIKEEKNDWQNINERLKDKIEYNYIDELCTEINKVRNNGSYNEESIKHVVDEILKKIRKVIGEKEKLKQIKDSFSLNGNKYILDSIFYSKEHKLATIKGEECAKYILSEGAEQMEELKQLNPVIKLFEENEDAIMKIERELEYSFFFKDYYYKKCNVEPTQKRVLVNDFYYEEVSVSLPVTQKNIGIPGILKYAIENLEYEGALNRGNFDDLLKAFVYKNFELLPFFRFKEAFKGLACEYKESNKYDLNELFKELKEKTKNIKLSEEFKTLVFIDDAKKHFWFYNNSEFRSKPYIHASPFLKILFNAIVESKDEFIKLHREVLEDNKIEKYNDFLNNINQNELIYVDVAEPYFSVYNKNLDMSKYINNDLENDMEFFKQLSINRVIDNKNDGFGSYASKTIYYYLSCDCNELKKAFKFREKFNMTIPFIRCRSKSKITNNDYIAEEQNIDLKLD